MIHVIFDLDGTLADTLKDLADAVNHGLTAMGLPVHPVESYRQMVGNGVVKLCERALPDDRKDGTMKLHAIFKEYYDTHYLDNTCLYDGMADALDALVSMGCTVDAATNKPQEVARMIVSKLVKREIAEKMTVLGGVDNRPKKPDPAIIHEVLAKYEAADDDILVMVGDSNVDIQTAKNAGMISIGCAWGFRGRAELEAAGADYIAECPADIVKIVENL